MTVKMPRAIDKMWRDLYIRLDQWRESFSIKFSSEVDWERPGYP